MLAKFIWLIFLCTISVNVYSQKIKSHLTPNSTSHSFYKFDYSEKYEQAKWLSYLITKNRVIIDKYERTNIYREDPLVDTGSANDTDYYNTGFDRGHLMPAEDCTFSKKAMSESFYFSNITPQISSFNRGIWLRLENQVRNWSVEKDSLIIITGSIIDQENPPTIGNNRVAIPNYFYKIIFDNKNSVIAFLIPHQKTNKSIANYVVPVNLIEKYTGIDFFSSLNKNEENKLENKTSLANWFYDLVNVNKATKEDLQKLWGVGPSTAQNIIDKRPYSKLNDLLNVDGIGDYTLEKNQKMIIF